MEAGLESLYPPVRSEPGHGNFRDALFVRRACAGTFGVGDEPVCQPQARPKTVVWKSWTNPSFAPPVGAQGQRFSFRGQLFSGIGRRAPSPGQRSFSEAVRLAFAAVRFFAQVLFE